MKPFKPFKILWDTVVTTKGGYKYVETDPVHPKAEKRPDRNKRYVYLHRVVLENKLKRYLKDNEEVKHLDDNPSNNDPSNLEAATRAEHQKGHAKEKKFWKKSPRTKPGRREAVKVVEAFLKRCIDGTD